MLSINRLFCAARSVVLGLSILSLAVGVQARNYAQHPTAQAFADSVAQTHQIDRAWLQRAMKQARFNPKVQRLMRPAKVKPNAPKRYGNWQRYRNKFLIPQRIDAGVDFWMLHNSTLQRAEKEFGVPAVVVMGILGVETSYGSNMGSFPVLDALATLAFDFPATPTRDRSAFFQDELADFLVQQYRSGVQPYVPVGSYAGAVGYGQFMPTSITRFAVDFDGDGRINLHQPVDAIGSVANYLRAHGWVTGHPAYFPAEFSTQLRRDAGSMQVLLEPDIVPSFDTATLQAYGMRMAPHVQQYPAKLALVELFNGDPTRGNEPHYILGTQNFYVVTRYNRSSYYALAVLELGQAVQRAYLNAQ